MRTIAKSLHLYWVVYALGFVSSAYFIVLGYGYAELNLFQRAFVTSPGLATLLPWQANQGVWMGLVAAGLVVTVLPRAFAKTGYLEGALLVLSFFRIYGVSTNVAFTLGAVYGLPVATSVLFVLFSTPVLALFVGELAGLANADALGALRPVPAKRN